MIRLISIFISFYILNGCVPLEERESYIANSKSLEFVSFWNYCFHSYSKTSDSRWLLIVQIPLKSGKYDVARFVELISLNEYEDINCAMACIKVVTLSVNLIKK